MDVGDGEGSSDMIWPYRACVWMWGMGREAVSRGGGWGEEPQSMVEGDIVLVQDGERDSGCRLQALSCNG